MLGESVDPVETCVSVGNASALCFYAAQQRRAVLMNGSSRVVLMFAVHYKCLFVSVATILQCESD